MARAGITEGFKNLTVGPQTFTAGWVPFGPVISVNGYDSICVFLDLLKNNSLDMRIRIVAKPFNETATTSYIFPILSPTASKIDVAPEFYEFTDVTQSITLSFNLNCVMHFVQFEIQAGTVGAPAGLVSGFYSLGKS